MKGYWYQHAMFYGIDIRRFQDSNGDGFGDIQGLISRLDYLKDLGISGLWLLPFFDTPLRDNGYDVRDYYRVDQRVGTNEDFVKLIEEAHKRGIGLVMDLVMNHTSNEHPWFQASRHDPRSLYHNYYVWSEDPPPVTPEFDTIFPGEEDTVWTYDPVAKSHYYHRFYHFQPELRISNPAVREEIFRAIDFWISLGVDGFRLDAAPIMIEPNALEETRLAEPHGVFQAIHSFTTKRKPDAVLLGEANLPMEQMDAYFGGGSEMNMLFNFLLGPHILLSLARKSARPICDYLKNLLDPPANDTWLNFLRNLDELSLEVMPEEQKQVIMKAFGPQENMQIYGRGLRRRIAPMMAEGDPSKQRQKMELAYSLLYSVPGSPILMYGDEIGMGEDLSLPGRSAVRTPMQWSPERNAGFSSSDRLIAPVIANGRYDYQKVNVADQLEDDKSLLNFVKRLIKARTECPEVGICHTTVLETETNDEQVVVHSYPPIDGEAQEVSLVLFHNLTEQTVTSTVHLPHKNHPKVHFGNGEITTSNGKTLTVKLPEHGYLWVRV